MQQRKAYLAIQCTAPGTDKTGDFLFEGAVSWRSPEARLASPIFAHLAALYDWAKANGWKPGEYDTDHPVGVYVKDAELALA